MVGASRWREVIGPAAAASLGTPPPGLEGLCDATWAWLHEPGAPTRAIVTLGDALYPPLLLDTADPPLLLYAQGRIDLLQTEGLAIVGSRNPTPQGQAHAKDFARHFSEAGWVVASGLALGIDGAAHEGALAGGAGTIAVVGTGLDRVYPKQHRDLAHRIAQEGLMLSEYALGAPALAAHFPQRNRIIAGLTRGTLVVEAALQSGSLITARLATEAGREVFAIPGSIHQPQARGCHALIKQGAKLVESAADVLDELPPLANNGRTYLAADAPAAEATPAPDALLEAMGYDPIAMDELVARTGTSPQELNIRLLDLELAGRVARLPGQLFQRILAA